MWNERRFFCALCERVVPGGGHPCVTDTPARLPEEHLAMCSKCEVFHEPHCAGATAPEGDTIRLDSKFLAHIRGPEGRPVCGADGPLVAPNKLPTCGECMQVARAVEAEVAPLLLVKPKTN